MRAMLLATGFLIGVIFTSFAAKSGYLTACNLYVETLRGK